MTGIVVRNGKKYRPNPETGRLEKVGIEVPSHVDHRGRVVIDETDDPEVLALLNELGLKPGDRLRSITDTGEGGSLVYDPAEAEENRRKADEYLDRLERTGEEPLWLPGSGNPNSPDES